MSTISEATDLGTPATKVCFLTTGATAPFETLIRTALSEPFLTQLVEHHYTNLVIQHGSLGALFTELLSAVPTQIAESLNISGFDFSSAGLHEHYLLAKRIYHNSSLQGVEGCVITHAGSGSVLEALRIEVPCVVVPNEDLLGNHQEELADSLGELGYVVNAKVGRLVEALSEVELLRKRMGQWPPINSQVKEGGLADMMDDELGWLD